MSVIVLYVAEGVLYQAKWDKEKIAIFTSARGISYIGLYQLYDRLFKELVTRINFKMRMRKLGLKSIRAPPSIRQSLVKLGALPNSSPVCGLLRISEMEQIVLSYDIKPPQVFYDLFLNKENTDQDIETDDFRDFCTSAYHEKSGEEPLVVSIPRHTVSLQLVSEPVTQDLEPEIVHPHVPGSGPSYMQSLAKKISQKNHRLAAAVSSSLSMPSPGVANVQVPTKPCYSCGEMNHLAKKRCDRCGVFLVGRPCPRCDTLNFSRCQSCVKCGYHLEATGKGKTMEHMQSTLS